MQITRYITPAIVAMVVPAFVVPHSALRYIAAGYPISFTKPAQQHIVTVSNLYGIIQQGHDNHRLAHTTITKGHASLRRFIHRYGDLLSTNDVSPKSENTRHLEVVQSGTSISTEVNCKNETQPLLAEHVAPDNDMQALTEPHGQEDVSHTNLHRHKHSPGEVDVNLEDMNEMIDLLSLKEHTMQNTTPQSISKPDEGFASDFTTTSELTIEATAFNIKGEAIHKHRDVNITTSDFNDLTSDGTTGITIPSPLTHSTNALSPHVFDNNAHHTTTFTFASTPTSLPPSRPAPTATATIFLSPRHQDATKPTTSPTASSNSSKPNFYDDPPDIPIIVPQGTGRRIAKPRSRQASLAADGSGPANGDAGTGADADADPDGEKCGSQTAHTDDGMGRRSRNGSSSGESEGSLTVFSDKSDPSTVRSSLDERTGDVAAEIAQKKSGKGKGAQEKRVEGEGEVEVKVKTEGVEEEGIKRITATVTPKETTVFGSYALKDTSFDFSAEYIDFKALPHRDCSANSENGSALLPLQSGFDAKGAGNGVAHGAEQDGVAHSRSGGKQCAAKKNGVGGKDNGKGKNKNKNNGRGKKKGKKGKGRK